MPEAAPEVVFTGSAKPQSWGERMIRAHTPEAHYQDLMKKYFWVTDRLEGPSLELAQRLRPQVEFAAKVAGWSQTITEVYLAGCAIAFTALLTKKGLKTAAEVFGAMAKKHGGEAVQERATTALVTIAGSVVSGGVLEEGAQREKKPLVRTFGDCILSGNLDEYGHIYDTQESIQAFYPNKSQLITVIRQLRTLPLTLEEARLLPIYLSLENPRSQREHLSLLVNRAYDRLFPETDPTDPKYHAEKTYMLEAIEALELLRQEPWVSDPHARPPSREETQTGDTPAQVEAMGELYEDIPFTRDQLDMETRPPGRKRGWKWKKGKDDENPQPSKTDAPVVDTPTQVATADTTPDTVSNLEPRVEDALAKVNTPLALSRDVFASRSAAELKARFGEAFRQVSASQDGAVLMTEDELFTIWGKCVNPDGKIKHDVGHAQDPRNSDDKRGRLMVKIVDQLVEPDRKEVFLQLLAQIDTLASQGKTPL